MKQGWRRSMLCGRHYSILAAVMALLSLALVRELLIHNICVMRTGSFTCQLWPQAPLLVREDLGVNTGTKRTLDNFTDQSSGTTDTTLMSHLNDIKLQDNINNDGDMPEDALAERLVDDLTLILHNKLSIFPTATRNSRPQTCTSKAVIGNSCQSRGCLQLQLPETVRDRVRQIIQPVNLQLSSKMQAVLASMRDRVPGNYDIIFLSAVSSSHFEESQALLYNLHTRLFPHLTNFTFILYNLQLTEPQRRHLAQICKCHLVDFPFEKFPAFMFFRKCYTWKPIILNAHITRTNLIFWIDASIRFGKNIQRIFQFMERGRTHGISLGVSKNTIPHDTLPSMFHFFGDEACAYTDFRDVLSGCLVLHKELFTTRAVLEPWAACAVSDQCMCPQNGVDLHQIRLTCHKEVGEFLYGVCHRFDQSALSILLSKLYQENVEYLFVNKLQDFDIDVQRGNKMVYPIGFTNNNLSSVNRLINSFH